MDLSKAYHMIKSGKLEKMTRLVVWRHCKEEEDFQVYGNDCMGMGDRPATNGLELTCEVAADKGREIDQEAAEKLEKDRFADDCLTGGSKVVVERMRRLVIAMVRKLMVMFVSPQAQASTASRNRC